MTKLIEEIEEALKQNAYSEYHRGKRQGYVEMRKIARKLLAVEREQIEMAYKADLFPCSDEDAAQYYNDMYQQG